LLVEGARQGVEPSQAVANGGDWTFEMRGGGWPALSQLFKKLELMADLRPHPIADKGNSFGPFSRLNLPAPDGRRAAHTSLPKPTIRVAMTIEKH
jgi:hypothetical protein